MWNEPLIYLLACEHAEVATESSIRPRRVPFTSGLFPFTSPPSNGFYGRAGSTLSVRVQVTEATMNSTRLKRIAASAAEALAGSILISLNLRWIAQARRKLRRWRAAA